MKDEILHIWHVCDLENVAINARFIAIYAIWLLNLLFTAFCRKISCVEKLSPKVYLWRKKWQISGLPEITWGGRGGGVIAEKEIVIQELYVSHLFNRWLSQYLPNAQNILKHSQLDLKSSYEVDTSPPLRVHVCTHSRCPCSALLHSSTNSGKRKFEHFN